MPACVPQGVFGGLAEDQKLLPDLPAKDGSKRVMRQTKLFYTLIESMPFSKDYHSSQALQINQLKINCIIQTMNYKHDYLRSINPLQNYYSNVPLDAKAQIKKVKSSENISLLKPEQHSLSKPDPKAQNPLAQPQQKKPFIEPGNPCEPFEEILSTTSVAQNGITTYFIAKALKGPLLSFASQECKKKQPAKKPSKKIPQIPEAISGDMSPHLERYATITHEGLYRQSNQDKITIYLEENAKWFSIYDGHGGTKCSQFLKEKLHQYFFDSDWRKDVPTALRKAFLAADAEWKKKGDNSGSCALVIFIHNNICYAANLGDSRAILVSEQFNKCYQITKDHKPSNAEEQKRIIEAGGKIYQTTAITETSDGYYDTITGPLRVYPGRLSTTRTFGDYEAKENRENSKIVINQPEITSFQIDYHDLIVMGSDGLWDKFENTEVVELSKGVYQQNSNEDFWYGKSAQEILLEAMNRGSTDNISVIMVGLNDPSVLREAKKGNEHIKILSSISASTKKKSHLSNKENSYPQKIKELDSKIMEINRNVSRVSLQPKRS